MRNIESAPTSQSKERVLSVGGASVDNFLVPQLGGSAREEGDNYVKEKGSKIPSELKKRDLGGNGANVARALARLGLHSSLYTHLGHEEDVYTEFIKRGLTRDGVDLQPEMAGDPTIGNDFSNIDLLSDDRIIDSVKTERVRGFNPKPEIKPDYLYLTSIGKRWEDVYAGVTEFAQQHEIPLAVSPGSTQLNYREQELYDAVTASNILLLDKKEGKSLLRKNKDHKSPEEPVDILLALQDLGPQTVSLTDGKAGSYLLTPEGTIYKMKAVEVPKEKVVDTTGAGDSYASGVMDALVRRKGPNEMMRQGALNGASVVQVMGAGDGLLTREQMNEQLEKYPNFQPKIIREPQF